MPNVDYYQKYLDYINNTGGEISTDAFDEDWEPIGEQIRSDLKEMGLITETDGIVRRRE